VSTVDTGLSGGEDTAATAIALSVLAAIFASGFPERLPWTKTEGAGWR
jgi:hypothetical protein